jgi:hypothetical protein
MAGFTHSIAGGQGNLIVTALQSPNFTPGADTGWQVTKAGDATFNSITLPPGTAGAKVWISETAPSGAAVGDIWWQTDADGDVQSVSQLDADGVTWDPYNWGSGSLGQGSVTAGIVAAGAIDGMTVNAPVINGGQISATDIIISGDNGGVFVYGPGGGGQIVQTFTASGTWTCPAGVTTAKVECQGGGAGGQWASGPGGGGGEYAAEPALAVTPGTVYTVTVGTGGAGGTSSSGPGHGGQNTGFVLSGTNLVLAHGAPTNNANPSAGGSGSTNTVHFSGGGTTAGSTGAGNGGAGGAGSGGTASAGQPGHANAGDVAGAGASAVTGGGAGGAGGAGNGTHDPAPSSPGTAGALPGGGGGAGGATSASGSNGGAGAGGQVRITYTQSSAMTTVVGSIAGAAGTDPVTGNPVPAGYMGAAVAIEPGSSPAVAETWHDVALVNGWAVGSSPNAPLRYRLLSDGNVQLNGVVSGGSATSTGMANLPAGYYNTAYQQQVPVAVTNAPSSGNNSFYLQITTAGAITIGGNTTAYKNTYVVNGTYPLN